MPSQYLIQGDKIIFKNPYQNQDIVLQHNVKGFSLVFASDIEVRGEASHTSVRFGDYSLTKENGMLTFKRGTNTLMTLEGPTGS